MTRFGYARVSDQSQDLQIQVDTLNRYACQMIRQEKASGTTMEGRDELKLLLEFMQPGDELLVTHVDRVARSVYDFFHIAKQIEDKGCSLFITTLGLDTKTPIGQMVIAIMAVFAKIDQDQRKARQMAGIHAYKASGKVIPKRGPKYDPERIREIHRNGNSVIQIMKMLGASEMTIRRAINPGKFKASPRAPVAAQEIT